MGHLIPVLELGNHLAAHHGIDVTIFVVVADPSISKSRLLGQTTATLKPVNVVLLPQVDISSLVSPTASVVAQIAAMMRAAVPSLRAAISVMSTPPTALVVDLFGKEALVLASEFNMLKYVFVTSTAWFLAVTVHLPSLSEKERHEHRVLKKPLKIPGCRAIQFEDTLEVFLDHPNQDIFPEFARLAFEMSLADGILVNTWRELEPSTLNELLHNKAFGRVTKVPVYPIGPLVRPVRQSLESDVTAWLDKQPKESVIYVSFGSGGTLSAKQTIELAWGLKLSQQRFVWVARPPADNNARGAFFNSTSSIQDGTPDYLPEGFFTSIRGMGLIVPMWAPQTEVLAHESIGAFLSHCGWNSTLESMVNGVPMITWPLYAEQKMNATMLAEELGMAVRLGPREAGTLVEREAIKDVLMGAMDVRHKGGKMRARAKELRAKARKALTTDGSSYNSLSQIAKEWEFRLRHLSNKTLGA
ncbi:hypothetical protein CDL15_Pgr013575 [Punica granatum]|uniref:Glycosyltransferase n=1 Tax=Punica granatum TaxID=22663 RepID=A0A218W1L5_PUNGR|nr:hypothetical protein CDL15_Pgr013575 [Punica granatum]